MAVPTVVRMEVSMVVRTGVRFVVTMTVSDEAVRMCPMVGS
jgi:hypothetical protein